MLLAIIVSWGNLYAKSPALTLTDETNNYSLGVYLDYLEDSEGAWTIDDVTSTDFNDQFISNQQNQLNFGVTSSVYWLRLTVNNQAPADTKWRLLFDAPIDFVDLYIPTESTQFDHRRSGYRLPLHTQDIPHRRVVFDINPLASESQTLYLRLESRVLNDIPATLLSEAALFQKTYNEQIMLGLIVGMLLIMAGYNLALYVALRDISYLDYVLFLIFYLVGAVELQGLARQYLWPNLILGGNIHLDGFTWLGLFFAVRMTRHFLVTETHTPRGDRILKILQGGFLVATLLIFPLPYHWFFLPAILLLVITIITLLILVTVIWRQGYRPARYFLLAILAPLAGGLIASLVHLGIFPGYQGSVVWLGQWSIVIQMWLLSLALADRINILRKDQEQTLQQQIEDKIVIDQLNTTLSETNAGLEQQVKARTTELANVNQQLKQDIIQRQTVEQALRDSEEIYRNVAEKANDLITIIQNGVIKYVNPQSSPILGYTPEEMMGESFSRFYPLQGQSDSQEPHQKQLPGEPVPANYEATVIHKQGYPVYIEIHAGLMEYEGQPATISIVRNITKRKQSEEILKQQQQITEGLHKSVTIINSSLELDIVLPKILEQLKQVVVFEDSAVMLPDQDDIVIVAASTDAYINLRIPLNSNDPAIRVFLTAQPLRLADVHNDPDWFNTYETSLRSFIGVPLLVDNQSIGVLAISNDQPNSYQESDVKILQIFANHAASAIQNARL
ncbi:MAG: 7TM diverse intracellular signaling domain-containing protein, partial [Chloroflexota bacterium]